MPSHLRLPAWILLVVFFLAIAVLFANSRDARLESRTPSTAAEFEVPAAQAWTPTEIFIELGDTLAIHYLRGLWSPWPGGAYDGIGFGGDPRCDCNVLQGISHAALIGRIGNGRPFYVGNDYRQPAGEAGQLYLGINDTRLGDNTSSIVVEISVQR